MKALPLIHHRLLLRFSAVMVLVWAGCAGCGSQNAKWQTLAELTDSSGNRFLVEQQHYDWAEGWRVCFSLISPEREIYGSLLETETGPWRTVRLDLAGNQLQIRRGEELVGMLDLSTRVFTNYLKHSFDLYVDGYDGVQGQRVMTNLHLNSRIGDAERRHSADRSQSVRSVTNQTSPAAGSDR